jgi:Nucleotidyl transferase AbiEii toxin, Type IV TA system
MTAVRAFAFWKAAVDDRVDLLDRLIRMLAEHRIRYCLVGGQAVNAYVEPVVSLDLDVVIAADQLGEAERLFGESFMVEEFPHSLNVSLPGSDVRVQLQTDPRYAGFVDHAVEREVLGLRLPVARLEDVLQGKLWAVTDPARRPSKRQKDLADIARLLEAYPALREHVPAEILHRLF